MTIKNPDNLDITVSTSDSSVATVTKNSNTSITINSLSKNGGAVITVTATDKGKSYEKKIQVGVWNNSGTMPVAYAKAVVNESNIASYIGTQVAYSPTGGGTWRIFYLDTTGKYRDGAGTLYIKRDYNSSTTVNDNSYTTYYSGQSNNTTKAAILADMGKFNPQWKANDNAIGNENENKSSYLCYRGVAEAANYVVSGVGEYAIMTPSIEMYMDSYNQWGGWETGRGPQSYKWKSSDVSGYNVGVNGSYPGNGYQNSNSLSQGPSNIYHDGSNSWWLASPSCYAVSCLLHVHRRQRCHVRPSYQRHVWGLPRSFSRKLKQVI